MKKNAGMFLSSLMLAVLASACCSTGGSYSDYPDPELRKAIENDIEEQIASYVFPYDEVKPLYSSDTAKDMFLAVPELKALAEAKNDIAATYSDKAGSVVFSVSRKDGVVSVETQGMSDSDGDYGQNLKDALEVFFQYPFTCVSQITLPMQKIADLDGASKNAPVEYFCGDYKCYPLISTAKHGSCTFIFSVETAKKNLKRLDVIGGSGGGRLLS